MTVSQSAPVPFASKRASDPRLNKIGELFSAAEQHLKKAELQCGHLVIPALNELRYAGHHLVKALNEPNAEQAQQDFHETESHCKRAIFDSVEIRLLDYMARIQRVEEDYDGIVISDLVSRYDVLRRGYLDVKHALESIDRMRREDYLSDCEAYIEKLQALSQAFDAVQPELRKALRKENRDVWLKVLGIFVTIVAVIVTIIFKYL